MLALDLVGCEPFRIEEVFWIINFGKCHLRHFLEGHASLMSAHAGCDFF